MKLDDVREDKIKASGITFKCFEKIWYNQGIYEYLDGLMFCYKNNLDENINTWYSVYWKHFDRLRGK
jgi:hypothetical protein